MSRYFSQAHSSTLLECVAKSSHLSNTTNPNEIIIIIIVFTIFHPQFTAAQRIGEWGRSESTVPNRRHITSRELPPFCLSVLGYFHSRLGSTFIALSRRSMRFYFPYLIPCPNSRAGRPADRHGVYRLLLLLSWVARSIIFEFYFTIW